MTAATSSRESYQTAPELSEPVKKLFQNILQKNNQSKDEKPKPSNINTMEIDTQPKTLENPDPTPNVPPVESPIRRPSINPVVFPELPPAPRPTKLKLASPKPFTGNREDLNGFLLDLNLYLTVNNEIYDTSFKKIGYALSFMTSGDTKSWKDQYLEEENILTLELGRSLQKHYENRLNHTMHQAMQWKKLSI